MQTACYTSHRDTFPEACAITAAIKTVNLALPDVTLRLDSNGVIREVSLANAVSGEGVDDWIGRPWAETVGAVGSTDVLHMVAEARTNGVSDFRQITQRFPSGLEVPMEYNTVRLGARAGLIAIGKNLQAVVGVQSSVIADQQAREQDSWKLRAVETRYRLLFESSDDPILLLRPDDLCIIDANPAAVRAGALDAGRDFQAAIAQPDRDAFATMMARVAEQGRAPGILLHLGATPWLVRASRAAAEPDVVFLLQLAPVVAAPPARRGTAALDELIERMPDGFALIDAGGVVRRANRAFLDLVQVAAQGGVVGQRLERWLAQPGADAGVLIASMHRRPMVRGFTTLMTGELGSETPVEISAAADSETAPQHICLLLRDVSRRPARTGGASLDTSADERLLAALTKLTQGIGQTPLLELVRDSSGLIERHCIEGALERVGGNRTAAAELLGLSRQSLYAKLSRYGMGGPAEEGAGD